MITIETQIEDVKRGLGMARIAARATGLNASQQINHLEAQLLRLVKERDRQSVQALADLKRMEAGQGVRRI